MMMITRTESRLEFGVGEQKSVSINVDRITCAMLAAERLPCGRVIQALYLTVADGCDPIRIDGSPMELTEVHQYVIETMVSVGAGAAVPRRVH